MINMTLFNNGDEHTFKKVFEKYYKSLFLFACYKINNNAESEDIVLIVFQKAFSACMNFDCEEKLKAYLFVCVANACKNHTLVAEHRKQRNLIGAELYAEAMQPADYREVEYFHLVGKVYKIHSYIEKLPKGRRRVAQLLLLEEYEPWEVAAELGISVQTVYVHKEVILKGLRKKLNSYK